jgi:hypothetical protein
MMVELDQPFVWPAEPENLEAYVSISFPLLDWQDVLSPSSMGFQYEDVLTKGQMGQEDF